MITLVWNSSGQKEVGHQMAQYSMPFEYRAAQPFEYQTNEHYLVYLNTALVFEWSVYYID